MREKNPGTTTTAKIDAMSAIRVIFMTAIYMKFMKIYHHKYTNTYTAATVAAAHQNLQFKIVFI